MRKFAKVAVVAGALLALTATAAPAFAATKTGPSGSPFVVPADASGNPEPIQVQASGFVPDQSVFIEQCDGTPSTTVGWDATLNCDLGSSPAPVALTPAGT